VARTGSGATSRCAVGADRCRADQHVRVAATGQHAAYDHRRLAAVPGHPANRRYQESARRTGRPSFTRSLIAASTITNIAPRSTARLATAASTITLRIASRWRLFCRGCSGSPGPRPIGAPAGSICRADLAAAASKITIRMASRWRLFCRGCSGSPGPREITAPGASAGRVASTLAVIPHHFPNASSVQRSGLDGGLCHGVVAVADRSDELPDEPQRACTAPA
jgi:hypothetical protein